MLKSTHRSAGLQPSTSLPEGWTEHTAPSGHKYYYNKSTKSSTYTRPTIETTAANQGEEPLFAEEAGPDPIVQATLRAQEDFARQTAQPGHFTGGNSYQQRPPRRGHGGDRPKTKAAIPDCGAWVLVTTKFGRRFVHNTETKQSLWKFPQDVMMKVIDMDRAEWERKQRAKAIDDAQAEKTTKDDGTMTVPKSANEAADKADPPQQDGDESSDYEEVEVTDDEAEGEPGIAPKRPRLSVTPPPATGPAELTEDDIAYQLAAMEADSDNYYDEDYPNSQPGDQDDEEEGLPMTASDSVALFRSLLDSTNTSPYTTFDSLLVLPQLVEDGRWLSLPNMSSRRDAFTSWSRDRVAELAALKEQQQAAAAAAADAADSDPKVQYLSFLAEKATPKLYWPEFKRKYKREEIMKAYEPSDKDKEKIYRDFVGKLKLGSGARRKELVDLLKSAEKDGGKIPLKVKRDVRYWAVSQAERDEVVGAWLG
ncbi:Pre-mRNA-splicing factor dre4 [Cyphellophora attinorum]|uniref:Pre-mRNA-splicing factor dre4 n=1 Tax=Cyphellophora attinorum TaxID=1664694 RepID=A0A0N1P142_9EURO|nr:Pre-mRNA-splicing factor dre4 [Phialophora attinorum]KPI40036.1 Pre-mRNA-splicing factor dre4 [Phialophora attinorum]